ncbi:MAG: hypothetical protein K8E66_09120, partial [Phycisphaerales bacterium]|nr:hypothetical protein [Phycisphaerales bacterium]
MTTRLTKHCASLRTKALATVVVLVTVTVFGVSLFNVVRTNRMIVTQQERAIDGLATGLAAAAELPLAVGDRAELARLTARFIEMNPGLQFIIISDTKHGVLAEAARDEALLGQYHSDSSAITESCLIDHQVTSRIEHANDLFIADNFALGIPGTPAPADRAESDATITIASSNAPILAAQKAQFFDSALTASVISLVSLPIAIYAVGRIT